MTTTSTSNPVTWFEIASSDPDSTMAFYGELFGWSYRDDEQAGSEYRMIDTGSTAGIKGGLADTKGNTPNHAVFYVQVPDVPATCTKAEELGGKVVLPATEGGGGLVFAYLLDSTGNHIGVFSEPPK
jgi:predicted enzyme related to lactoylglutathione lyase